MDPDQAPDTGDRAPTDAGPVATRDAGASQDVRGKGLANGGPLPPRASAPDAAPATDPAVDGVVPGVAHRTGAAAGNGADPTPDQGAPDAEDEPPGEASASGVEAMPALEGTPPAPVDAAPEAAPVADPEADPEAAPVAAQRAAPGAAGREQIPWPIIWSAIGVVVGAFAALELVVALERLIELLLIASFLAVVLSPAVAGLVRLRMRRGLATTVVFLLGMAAFGGLGYLFIHPLYRQATHFANDLPGTLARVQAGKGRIGKIVARYHLQNDAAKYAPKVQSYLSHLGGPALSAAKTVLRSEEHTS